MIDDSLLILSQHFLNRNCSLECLKRKTFAFSSTNDWCVSHVESIYSYGSSIGLDVQVQFFLSKMCRIKNIPPIEDDSKSFLVPWSDMASSKPYLCLFLLVNVWVCLSWKHLHAESCCQSSLIRLVKQHGSSADIVFWLILARLTNRRRPESGMEAHRCQSNTWMCSWSTAHV